MPRHFLEIYTYPVRGDIYVNDVYWGKGYAKRLVSEGLYTIRFGAVEGYATPPTRTVYVAKKTVERGRYIRLVRRHLLEVDTSPVKGAVYIDGVYVGTAPTRTLVSEGVHTVTFGDIEGYITPAPRTVNVVGRTRIYALYSPIPYPPEIVYFRAVPEEITLGESSVLEWSTRNAVRAEIDGRSVPTSGRLVVSPTRTTTYTLTVTSPYGLTAAAKVTVRVVIKRPWIRVVYVLPLKYEPGAESRANERYIEVHAYVPYNKEWDPDEADEKMKEYFKYFLKITKYDEEGMGPL
ncbi:MAG: PEGA domain-containing protein, partial [Thermoproteota archaeon]